MTVPDHIVRALDDLEMRSDDPVVVTRLVGELRFHLARWAGEGAALAREVEQKGRTIRELTDEIRELTEART